MFEVDRAAVDFHGAYVAPSDVAAAMGHVIIDGPGGIALTLTPEAAAETGRRLLEAAGAAGGVISRR